MYKTTINFLFYGVFALLISPLATAFAGTNENFEPFLDQERIRGPQVGDFIEVQLSAAAVSGARQNRIELAYDPAYLGEFHFVVGDLIPPPFAPLMTQPEIGADGLARLSIGGAQLGNQGDLGVGTGIMYTIQFTVLGDIPPIGTFVSITKVQINLSEQDGDLKSFDLGEFGIELIPDLPNKLFDFEVYRAHNGAAISWKSRFPGIEDEVRYRLAGENQWRLASSPLAARTNDKVLAALRILRAAEIDLGGDSDLIIAALQQADAALLPALPANFIDLLILLEEALEQRRHVVVLTDLAPGATYEYEARSIGLQGQLSPPQVDIFQTRTEPDRRPLNATNYDVQTTSTAVTFRWQTNRRADTRLQLKKVGGQPIAVLLRDEDGQGAHIVSLDDLEPDTAYEYTIGSRLVDADLLIAAGIVGADEVAISRTGTLHTQQRSLPVRLISPPVEIVGPESAVIVFDLNQSATAVIDYGLVENQASATASQYQWSITSTSPLDRHSITLTDLDPASCYRYRIRLSTPEGTTLSTDPSGNFQWSRDLQFKTSVRRDDKPPVIVAGPQVFVRHTSAVFHLTTDVPTEARVFIGTRGGTFGTADEFEFVNLAPSGIARFAQKHLITAVGLDAATAYAYRIEVKAANGQTATLQPFPQALAKASRALQPPGGSGSFVTNSQPDTQFPVILSGPSITSRTHDTAIVEWTTDEPADSEVRYGIESLDNTVFSGDNEINHKLVMSNLVPAASYGYIVGSTDPSGNGATESPQAFFTTSPEIDLKAPVIAATPVVVYKNDRSVTIQWGTDEDAISEVEFGPTRALGFVRTLLAITRQHEVTLTNLDPATTYFYQVASTDLSNNGPTRSTLLSFTTDSAPDLTPPVINAVDVSVATDIAIVRWNTDELADSFVEYGADPNLLDQRAGSMDDVLEHEIALTNLTPESVYFFRVGSIDRSNNPPTLSVIGSFSTAPDTTAPAPPANLNGVPGSNQIALSWDANAEIDLAGYNIYRRHASGDYKAVATHISQQAYVDQGLENGTEYDYRVTAIDRSVKPNESFPSAVLGLRPTASAAPTAPTDLDQGGDILRPILSFSNAVPFKAGAILTYIIQLSTEPDFSNVSASISNLPEGTGDAPTGQTSWQVDRPLEEGAVYYWRVRAVEGSLLGAFSATQVFTAAPLDVLVGDFTGDNAVTFDDFFLLVDVFGQPATGAAAPFDLDGGGTIDFNDFFLFVDNFGKTSTAKPGAGTWPRDVAAVFSIEVSGGTRAANRLIDLALQAEYVEDLKAFGAIVEYDPRVVEFQAGSATPGQLLATGGTPVFGLLAQAPGQIIIGGGLPDAAPAAAQGPLAQLQFRLVGPSNMAAFDLEEVYIARSGDEARQVVQLSSGQLRPRAHYLGANFPNPFNPSTTVEYGLPQAGPVELTIYDILGQRVRTLVRRDHQAAGLYTTTWDGRDEEGRAVANGLFLYRLRSLGFDQTRKMMLVK